MMDSKLAKKLRQQFSAMMGRAFPSFEPSAKASFLWPGERAYVETSGSIQRWIVLVPHEKEDKFTVEVGWSVGGTPEFSARPSFEAPGEAGSLECYICRLGELLHPPGEGWQRIRSHSISEAIGRDELELKKHGVPFIRSKPEGHPSRPARKDRPLSRGLG